MSRLDALLHRLQQFSPDPFLEGDGQAHSYSDLLDCIDTWSERLVARGIGSGAVVAVRADYALTSIALLLALLKARAIVVLIPRTRVAVTYLHDSCAQWLCDIDVEGGFALQALEAPRDHELLRDLRSHGDGGLVIFTSGTSGTPKAALQSTQRFLSKFTKPGRRLRTLAFLLFDHVAGMDTLFYTLSNGGCLVVTRKRDPDSILHLLETSRVEVLPASPSFLRLLCLEEDSGRHDLSHLQVITYGSEPMDAATLARLNKRFPHIQIAQKYGTTETGSPRSTSRGNDSLWLRLTGDSVETRVTDGVLWIRSESTILGYLNAPSPLDGAGWYCTGDQVEVDGEWLRFVGRASETINVGGEKVSPNEVEQVILELDGILEAVVRGEKHAIMGQIVTARVVLVPGANARDAARRIRLHCGDRLSRYKVPVKIAIESASLAGDRQKILRHSG